MVGEVLPLTAAQLESGIERGLHLGGQLSVRGPDLNHDFAFGEVRPGEPMTAEHRMVWLSASKPLTAVAIAQQWEEGVVDFDDRVADHVPEFATGGKEAITVRHLLTHTSGIRMFSTGWPDQPWDEIIARICARKIEPRWVPGEKAGYHQASSWFILGEILRRATGRSIGEYLGERVFAPAGMASSMLGMDPETYRRERESFAPVFDTAEGGDELPWTSERYLVPPSPGANAVGRLADLADFYRALLDGGQGTQGCLLLAETVRLITRRHRTGMLDHTFKAELDWGLGFILNPSRIDPGDAPYAYGPSVSASTFGHGGKLSVVAFADPEASLAVALAWNGTPGDADHRRRVVKTLEAVYGDLGVGSP